MDACRLWNEMVEAEHAQSERARAEAPPDDHWQPFAESFKADPHRTDDSLLNHLLQAVEPDDTLLDVGAGGGRLALPLALKCRHVVAVEPSSSMGSVLLQQSTEFGIKNVSLVQARWEEAEVDPEDVVLCAHVLYVVRDIKRFVRKIERHARRLVMVVLFGAPPQSQTHSLWQQVHGETRLSLPGLHEFKEVLKELDIDARVDMLPSQPQRGFENLQQAKEQLTNRLFLAPGGDKSRLLETLLPDVLEESDGVFRIRNVEPLALDLVSWRPAAIMK